MGTTFDPWIPEIARRPIAFSQVREDPLLDQWVVGQLEREAAVIMIASGGCTAAVLAGNPGVSRLHLVDANPAQIALTRLKLRLLECADEQERLAILGHTPMPPNDRRDRLAEHLQNLDLAPDVLGPPDLMAEIGPDQGGRYESLFFKLQQILQPVSTELAALLELRSPNDQSRLAAPDTSLGQALDSAFDKVMSLPNLVGLFGEGATNNRREPFSRHFARRTRHALATLPAASNPYLWQLLKGQFPQNSPYTWFILPKPARLPEITWSHGFMSQVLAARPDSYDFVHLSNILDWLTPEEAAATLDNAWRALRPGGYVFIRQLNSNLDIQKVGASFNWKNEVAQDLHNRDRSFFYRLLHLGQKK